jgi:hypothetical protein
MRKEGAPVKINPREWLALPDEERTRRIDEVADKSAGEGKVTVELLDGRTETISRECFETIMVFATLDLLKSQLKDAYQQIKEMAKEK